MEDTSYVIRGGLAGRERLRVLGRVVRATTRSLLERAALKPGMTCLDVGCGGGDSTFEIARMVEPGGHVVGIDMDETKIELARSEAAQLGLSGVEFRIAHAGEIHGAAEFDVVYARFVLTHLRDPAETLGCMYGVLRPGGVAIVEDIDFRGHFCHPESRAFQDYVELYTQLVRRRGADPNIGPRLPGLLRDAGCANLQMYVVQPAGIEGEVKLIAAITMENIVDALLAEGLAPRAAIDAIIDELYALAEDGRTVMGLPRIVQAW